MTKKELQARIKELEDREIILEAIVQNMYDGFEKVSEHPAIGFILGQTNIESFMMQLYNTAEIRSNIDELVDITAVTD